MTAPATGDIHQRILDQATQLFMERGYHGLSMREIAEAVQVSKAGLYYHFQDKEQLFLAILNYGLDQLNQAMQAAEQTSGGVEPRLQALLRAIMRVSASQRAVMRLASHELAHLSAATQASFRQRYYDQFIGRIERIVRDAIAQGEIKAIDPHLATWVFLGMVYPFFSGSDMRDGGADPAQIEMIVGIFLNGVKGSKKSTASLQMES